MAHVIHNKILNHLAQKNVNDTQRSLTTSMQRLSVSGERNNAKNDVTSGDLKNRIGANASNLSQPFRHTNDVISIVQTMQGALNEVNTHLQNIRRLAVEAQHGANSDSESETTHKEISTHLAEINRISAQTEFDGIKVLSTNQTLNLQAGPDSSQPVTIDLYRLDTSTLGIDGFNATQTATRIDMDSYVRSKGNMTNVATKLDKATEGNIKNSSSSSIDDAYSTKNANGAVIYVEEGRSNVGAVISTVFLPTFHTVAGTPPGTGTVAFAAGAKSFKADERLIDIDAAIRKVDDQRTSLSALQNSLDPLISKIKPLSELRPPIPNAAIISRTSHTNARQSKGSIVLAQANQVPKKVLSLLR